MMCNGHGPTGSATSWRRSDRGRRFPPLSKVWPRSARLLCGSPFKASPCIRTVSVWCPRLEMIKSDLADPTSDRVIEVLILAYERGGTVVPEILSDLADATTKDLWTLEEIRTDALEQKINSRIVFILPWLVLVAMTARAGPFREFYVSPMGVLVAVIGGVMSLVGVVIASRLGAQPAEPRVFVSARGGGE